MTLIIRDATPDDAVALAAIYGDACLHGFGTFEEEAPAPAEMARRLAEARGQDLPYLVAERDEAVVGMCYAKPFRPRSAYRFTVEDSVYVAPAAKGSGVGRALLSRLIALCEAKDLRQMTAVIGDSGNVGSIALHQALGFTHRGLFEAVGYKHGRWVDIVLMQRPLNAGAATQPSGQGQTLRET